VLKHTINNLFFCLVKVLPLVICLQIKVESAPLNELRFLDKNHQILVTEYQSPVDELSIVSNFLAGFFEEEPKYNFENFSKWKEYASLLDSNWQRTRKNRIIPMNKWRNTELGDIQLPVFYPMGGPDVLNLLTFFPNSEQYIIVGLEPVFNLQTLEDLNNEGFANELVSYLEQSMKSLFIRSFFITQDMNVDLKKFGIAPIMIALIKRLGYEIISFKTFTYKQSDEVQTDQTPNPMGLELAFTKKGSKNVQRLYYFKKNMHDSACVHPFLNLVEEYAPIAVMFKSTSYTLHIKEFSNLSNFVQKNAEVILQDDTGLPYETLKKYWDVTLYGKYNKPYGKAFKDFTQLDLAHEYQVNTSIKKLNFNIGYGYGRAPSCLMIARKKQ
jgi:hypothetical protein